jgi:cell wall-active antibiotic response 4TMS protein YvqF
MTTPYRPTPLAAHASIVRTLPEDLIPERSGCVAWWTGTKRDHEWILPRIFRGFCFMGHIELDLTMARVGSGTSEMELKCIMGNIEVTVPPDIRVVCDGDAVAGNFEVERVGNTTPPPDAPTIHITGSAYFGAVTIKIIDPNAPTWRKRLRAWAMGEDQP